MFHKIDPKVEGPAPVDEAVANMLSTVRNLTVADSGKFVTHKGVNVYGESGLDVDWF